MLGVPPERRVLLSRRDIPQADAAVPLPGRHELAVGAKGHVGGVLGRFSLKGPNRLSGRHIPEADGAVLTAGGDELAVRAEGDRVDRRGVPGQNAGRRLRVARRPPAEVPQPDGAVRPARGDGPPVRADRHGPHLADVRSPLTRRGEVVDADERLVGLMPVGEQGLSVGGETHAREWPGDGQPLQFLGGGHVPVGHSIAAAGPQGFPLGAEGEK